MNLKKLNETDFPLLNRKNIDFEIEFTGATPKKEDVLKSVSAALGKNEDLISIKRIHQKYGVNKAEIKVHVYDKVEDLRSFELFNKKSKEKNIVQKAEVKKDAKKENKE